MKLAPIILFAYNRKAHLTKTLEALGRNRLSKESELYIFSDGAKKLGNKKSVKEVRDFLHGYIKNNPFSKTYLYESKDNKGLSRSIIDGVSKIIPIDGKAIIIEDDVITAADFLEYMNTALNYYEDSKHVFSVGGLTAPMEILIDYGSEVIATGRCSSCCWGTWYDRWIEIDWEMQYYKNFRFNFINRRLFNRWGNDRATMLDYQYNNRIDSWAIRFEYQMWKSRKINILPRFTRAINIGMDGSGTHSLTNDILNTSIKKLDTSIMMADIDTNENIRNEYRKTFDTAHSAVLKRYISNLTYSSRNLIKEMTKKYGRK